MEVDILNHIYVTKIALFYYYTMGTNAFYDDVDIYFLWYPVLGW